jgi:hypothetical protein
MCLLTEAFKALTGEVGKVEDCLAGEKKAEAFFSMFFLRLCIQTPEIHL